MNGFYLMTKKGTTPPKFLHRSMESAVREAYRLSELLNDEVFILEFVGKVVTEEVPVTKRVTRAIMNNNQSEEDDLPF